MVLLPMPVLLCMKAQPICACVSDYGLPLFQATPTMPSSTPHDVIDALTKRTQDGGTEVVEAKAGKVSSPGCDALASSVCCV
jgi:malate/lactate dehydrogenase